MDTNTVLFIALLVVLLVGISAIWAKRGGPGRFWLKWFGAEAKLEQGEAKDISQKQEGGFGNEQKVDVPKGIKIDQTQTNGVVNKQSVRVRDDK
jgi:hypothetical protein